MCNTKYSDTIRFACQNYQAVEKHIRASRCKAKRVRKRSLCVINEHFEPIFNTVATTQIIFQRPAKILSYLYRDDLVKNTSNLCAIL